MITVFTGLRITPPRSHAEAKDDSELVSLVTNFFTKCRETWSFNLHIFFSFNKDTLSCVSRARVDRTVPGTGLTKTPTGPD